MIVADTGNNRLQVFHTGVLAGPRDNPGFQAASMSRDSDSGGGGGGSGSRRYAPPSAGDAPMNNTTGTSRATPSSPGSSGTWARSQAAPPPPTETTPGQGRASSPSQQAGAAGRRRPGAQNASPEKKASAAGEGPSDAADDVSPRACLLVFDGGEDAGRLRKRRTAGESEAGEGALCQPCDLAYWRARQPGRGAEGPGATWAWTPDPPCWFRPRTGHGCPGSFALDEDDDEEDEARRALLSPPVLTPQDGYAPSRPGDRNHRNERSVSRDESAAAGRHARDSSGGGGAADGSGLPLLGSFVVRETGLRDKLQLLFVAKTKVWEVFSSWLARGANSCCWRHL